MPQIINTNIASLNAQRNLNNAQSANDTALQRLSSGLRINSAADDAAGLSISTRFDAQISGSNVAIRNSGDGVSLAQTAEGALDSITDNLQRIRELAVQAANGTNSDIDREALNLEAQQLIAEVENVSENANFNGTKLLDGSFEDVRFQTGANATDSINVSINELSTDTLGVAKTAGVSSIGGEVVRDSGGTATATDAAANALANGDLTINGVAIEASIGSDDSASFADADASAIAKAAAINEKSGETGVTAVALENTVLGQSSGATNGFSTVSGTVDLNGVTVSLSVNQTLDADTNREAVAAAINSVSGQTGVVAVNTGDDDTGVSLVAADGRNITLGNLTGASVTSQFGLGGTAAGTATNGSPTYTFTSSVLLQSSDGSDIDIAAGTGDLENSGFTAGTKSGQVASLSSTVLSGDGSATSTDVIAAGDLTINGVSIRETSGSDDNLSYDDGSATMSSYTDVSAIARAAAINEVSDQTGVTAVVEANVVAGTQTQTSAAAAAGDIVVNGVTTASIDFTETDADARRAEAVDAINAISGRTGVTATDSGDGIELRAEDGRNIVLQQDGASQFASVGIQDADATTTTGAAGEISIFTSTIRLEAAGEFTLGSETGNIEETGFRAGTYGAEDSGTLLKDVNISTVDGALDAISAIDNALGQVSEARANLGATQNRFESTINNLTISSENLSASNSRIRDADYATETAELSRTQVLIQAGISVLSQANARPQQVLSLLG